MPTNEESYPMHIMLDLSLLLLFYSLKNSCLESPNICIDNSSSFLTSSFFSSLHLSLLSSLLLGQILQRRCQAPIWSTISMR